MQLHKDDWHVRVYQWWYTHKYGGRTPKTQSNLCPYVRAVMFWAPFRAIFWNWITVLKLTPAGNLRVTLNMLTIPFLMFAIPQPLGYISYMLKIVAWVLTLGSTAFAILLVAIVCIQVAFDDWRSAKLNRDLKAIPDYETEWHKQVTERERRMARRIARRERRKAFWKPVTSFCTILGAYLRSGHDRICPEIQIVDTLPPASPEPGSSSITHEV